MRVGYDAGGATPLDASGAKATGASPGDAPSAGAGFFALLALLQGAAASGEASAPGTGELVGEAEPGDGEGTGEGGEEPGPGDVIVSLSGAAVASASADPAGAAGVANTAGTGGATQAQTSGTGGASVAARGGGEPATLVAGSGGAAVGVVATAPAEKTADVATGSAEAVRAAAVAGDAAVARGQSTAKPAPAAGQAQVPHESDASTAPAAAGGAIPQPPAVATPATRGTRDDAARPSGESAGEGTSVEGTIARDLVGDGSAAASGDPADAEAEGDARERAFAGFGEARRSFATSAERAAVRVGLEPAGSALQQGAAEVTRSGGDGVPVARDAAAPVDAGGRAAASTQRAPLGDGATLPSWIERLTSPQRLAARRSTALRIDLEPAGLGRIEVRLSFGRDGVRAQVMTEHDHTRALLAQQQPQLAAAFERSDLRLESFLVDVGVGGDASGEAHREVEEPAAWDAAFANGAAREGEHEVPSATVVTGLLSVRA